LKGSSGKKLDFLHAGALKNYTKRRPKNEMQSKMERRNSWSKNSNWTVKNSL
jgi:hypothetical protein